MKYSDFDKYMLAVDKELTNICDMVSDDLEDVDYWSMFDSGTEPLDAARYALEYSGYPEELMDGCHADSIES